MKGNALRPEAPRSARQRARRDNGTAEAARGAPKNKARKLEEQKLACRCLQLAAEILDADIRHDLDKIIAEVRERYPEGAPLLDD